MSSQPTATVTVTPPIPVASSSAPTTPAVAQQNSGSKILDVIQPFVIGGVSGMFATCIIQPVDMIKVSIQLKSEEQVNHKARISPFTVAG